MTLQEIRCTAPHPDNPFRSCRAKLAKVVPGSVAAERGNLPPAGGSVLSCWRCGTEWVVTPAEAPMLR